MLSIAIKPKGYDEDEEQGYDDDAAWTDAARDMLAAIKQGDAAALGEALRTCCELCMSESESDGAKRHALDEESEPYE